MPSELLSTHCGTQLTQEATLFIIQRKWNVCQLLQTKTKVEIVIFSFTNCNPNVLNFCLINIIHKTNTCFLSWKIGNEIKRNHCKIENYVRISHATYIQVPVRPEAKSWRIIPAKRTTTGNREKFDECGWRVFKHY